MSIAEFGIKNKVFTIFSLFIIVIMGMIAMQKMPKLEDPALVSRVITIKTSYPGMAVNRMSSLVLKPVEDAVGSVPQVKYLFSTVSRGDVTTSAMIDDSIKDVKPIMQDIRNKLADVQLPSGCSEPKVIDNEMDIAFASLAVTFSGHSINELDDLTTYLKGYFQSNFSKIAYATVFGVPDKKFYIEADSHKLALYHLTVSKLQSLFTDNHVLSSGGVVHTGVKNIVIVPNSEFKTLHDIKNMLIKLPESDQYVRLSDIAHIAVKEVTPVKSRIYLNHKRVAIVALYPANKVNLVSLGEQVKVAVNKLNDSIPKGFHIEYSTFRPASISATVNDFAKNLYMAMLIVGACVIVFLTVRAGVLVGITVPLSMLLALTIMYFLNVPLERMTLAGLIISLGLLVDNGMVIVEDTRFAMDQGMDRLQAAKTVAKKLAAPLLVSQLTTILAFAPPLLAKNTSSEYVGGMSLTVLIVLLCSWFLSQWALPLLCSIFLKPTPKDKVLTQEQIFSKPFYRFYKKWLTRTLNNRLFTVLLVALIFSVSIWAMKFTKVEFMPKFPSDQIYVSASLPNGSDTSAVLNKMKKMVPYLLDKKINPDIKHVTSYYGADGPQLTMMNRANASENSAYFLIKLGKLNEKKIQALELLIRKYLSDNFTGVKFSVGRVMGLSAQPGQVQVNILGPDPQKLYQYGLKLESALAKVPHTYSVTNSWGKFLPSIELKLNRYAINQAGISVKSVVNSVKNLINGTTVGQMDHGSNLIPIEFRLHKAERSDISKIESLSLYSSKLHRRVALRDIAEVKLKYVIPRINTFQRAKTIHITGINIELGVREALKRLQPAIEGLNMSPGYRIKIRGESESQGEANEALFGSALPCVFAIFLILIYQFGSVRKMIILFLILPMALIGVVLGLVVTQVPFGFMPTFGVIALVGLVVNDGVILLEAITEGKNEGLRVRDTLLRAGQTRLRPIVLTTVTTFFGMLPLVLFGGPLWEGLAIVFVSGELVSTLLLLILVPVLYSLFFRYWRSAETAQ